jgi:hypothetical protein
MKCIPSMQHIEQAAQKSWLECVLMQLNTIVPPPPPPPVPYNATIQAKIDEKAIASAAAAAATTNTNRQKITASQESAANACVEEWISAFDKHGRSGYIGLVPRPLQSKYSTATTTTTTAVTATTTITTMEQDSIEYVKHFCAWFLNNKK